jgi:diphthine-ammonia ligase
VKTFISWSGGKEASLSFYRAIQNRDIEVACLLNMMAEDGEHSRTHGIGSGWLRLQADALGIPIIQRKTSWQTYEKEFKAAVSGFKTEDIRTGIFGDIDVQEHRDWVERICHETGIRPILPLWKEERESLLKEFIRAGFKAVVVATRAESLDRAWLGRSIDEGFIEELKAMDHIDFCGENGEYHTFVYDGPIFRKPVEFTSGEKVLRDGHWFLEIRKNG